jgi:hypothetical protein
MENVLDLPDGEREEMAKKYMLEESYGAPHPDLYVGFLAGFHAAYKLVLSKNEEKMENGNKPINPILDWNEVKADSTGLTKREYFAGLAMQGLMSNPEFIKGGSFDFESRKTAERVSRISTKVADEVLKQLEK